MSDETFVQKQRRLVLSAPPYVPGVPATYYQIARELGVTPVRVQQIEATAIRKLRARRVPAP